MTIIKQLEIECTRCGFHLDCTDADERWDRLLEYTEEDCPGCQAQTEEEI